MVEMSEECRTAFQAALELIGEKCGVSFDTGKASLNPDSEYVLKPSDLEDIHRRADLNLRRIRGSIGCLKKAAEECDLHSFLPCYMLAENSSGGLDELALTVRRDKYTVDTRHLASDLIKEVNRFADKFEEDCLCRPRTREEKQKECVLKKLREGKAEFIISRDCGVTEAYVRALRKGKS